MPSIMQSSVAILGAIQTGGARRIVSCKIADATGDESSNS